MPPVAGPARRSTRGSRGSYADLGLETRFLYVSFRFDDMPGVFPPELRRHAHDGVVRRTSMPLVVTPISRVESALPPEHEERLLGIDHRTSLPRSVVRRLNVWLDTRR